MRGVADEVLTAITGDEAPAGERATPPRDAVVRNAGPAQAEAHAPFACDQATDSLSPVSWEWGSARVAPR